MIKLNPCIKADQVLEKEDAPCYSKNAVSNTTFFAFRCIFVERFRIEFLNKSRDPAQQLSWSCRWPKIYRPAIWTEIELKEFLPECRRRSIAVQAAKLVVGVDSTF